ncbi:unnamed protein product, partial [Mesorhabditis belari]|uniref:Uncharacterized protein n=1 Tax=Mesorhabditis belari TaxID=2138241 RepID=A0AAF3EE10_9BILA
MATNPITLISYIGMAQANCTTTILAGGVPGKTLNQAFILDAIGKDDRFMDSIIRSSVFTVYVPAGCRADIKFGDRDQAYTTFDGLRDQGRAIISSFEYPWEFDDTTKYEAEVIGEYRMDNNATMLNITFHISEIVGGLLSIYVPNFDPNGRLVSSSNMT